MSPHKKEDSKPWHRVRVSQGSTYLLDAILQHTVRMAAALSPNSRLRKGNSGRNKDGQEVWTAEQLGCLSRAIAKGSSIALKVRDRCLMVQNHTSPRKSRLPSLQGLMDFYPIEISPKKLSVFSLKWKDGTPGPGGGVQRSTTPDLPRIGKGQSPPKGFSLGV